MARRKILVTLSLSTYVKHLAMNQRQVTLHMTNAEYLLLLRKAHIRAGKYAVTHNQIESEIKHALGKGRRAA